jgi:ATP-dependent exoDNAse (exonuclease V) alpha subunit
MYEELLNDLVKTELSFELSNDQYIILLAIFSILESDGFQEITLSGSAGKTELIKIINKFCIVRNLNCQFAAPTHKAAEVLSSKLEVLNSVKTIHQLLNLTTKINIIDFDFKNIIFENVADVIFSKNQIIIIDECSMINDSLYDKC